MTIKLKNKGAKPYGKEIMENKVVSFIVPSYNSECWLEKCLYSFCCKETLKDIEVIVVNDGSTDETSKIGKNFSEKYPQVFRVIDKKNGGHGSAINVGISEASGRYLKVVDSDDWIDSGNLPAFVKELKNTSAEVILTCYRTVNAQTGIRTDWTMFLNEYGNVINLSALMKDWKQADRCLTFHGITYKTTFYRKHNHLLLEGVYYEDHEYAAIPCCFAERILPLNLFLYEYRIGTSTQSVATKNQLQHLDDLEKVAKRLLSYYTEKYQALSESGREFFYHKIETVILSYYKLTCLSMKPRRRGRSAAVEMQIYLSKTVPDLYIRLLKKLKVFLLLNYLGISEGIYTMALESRIYNYIRRNHGFIKEKLESRE